MVKPLAPTVNNEFEPPKDSTLNFPVSLIWTDVALYCARLPVFKSPFSMVSVATLLRLAWPI